MGEAGIKGRGKKDGGGKVRGCARQRKGQKERGGDPGEC